MPGDYAEESEARAARQLLSRRGRPTGVLAGNDLCAAGLLETLVRAGVHAPEDISVVVGYDDSRTARLSYMDLTSVHQDAVEMGELAVRAAAERLDEKRAAEQELVLTPRLAVRGSTGPPPGA
ncbi:substrate-binding domain-containing protein [Salinifilum ghardaiensis]